jgi:signal transduction histidine kinase
MGKGEVKISIVRNILEAFQEPLFVVDSNAKCVSANRAFLRFVGASSLTGLAVRDFWPGYDNTDLLRDGFTAELHLGGSARIQAKMRMAQIEDNLILYAIQPGMVAEPLDRFHSQRLETLGMLAGGVAHDFNNVLTGILGHITYLKAILPAAGIHSESLTAIEDGARKGSLMTQQILTFSRLETAEKPAPLDLCDLVKRTCTLLRGAISPKFELQYDVPEIPVHVVAVEGKLAQVIVNLVINARDAIEGSGIIHVKVESSEAAEAIEGLSHEMADGRFACLTVRDNGKGMPSEVLDRAFEPYFTTKGSLGTGLGLATVQAIVKLFSGGIDISSTVNKGTIVKVYLPIFQPARGECAKEEGDFVEELVGGTERVLVVDDEAPVRSVLMLSLQHLGYSVDAAASGLEALEKYRSSGGGYDLVIVDMLMPQLSGDEVFFRLKEINPSVKVLVISGYSSEEAVQTVLAQGGRGFIQKPFTIEDLAEKVRLTLDSGPQPLS